MNSISSSPWICCQLGAREHYAIPRALDQSGHLAQLITDAWVPPQSILNCLPNHHLQSLRERFHPDLAQAPVCGFTQGLIQFELSQKLQKRQSWDQMIARNHWFQRRAIQQLERSQYPANAVLFTYSYAALELLRYAKKQGWQTVLGQIDPGMMEEKIVQAERDQHPDLAPDWQPVPIAYWQTWREECQLADRILVNSAWSANLLAQAGINPRKLEIVPLVYAPPPQATAFTRSYPERFTQERPLRVLFLGQVTLRKGIAAVLEAIRLLTGEPIEFWFVGAQQITIPDEFINHPQVRWVGSVARSQVQHYYQQADVFLFPTLSDGFGLTQLEAQAWKLPLIASAYCGEVAVDKANGRILDEVIAQEIAKILQDYLQQPEQLLRLAQPSKNELSLPQLSQRLLRLTESIFCKRI